MQVKIIRAEPTKETLQNLYELLNKIIKNDAFFYTDKEVTELKKDRKNVFL